MEEKKKQQAQPKQNIVFPLIGYEIKFLWFKIKVTNIYLNPTTNQAVKNEWKT